MLRFGFISPKVIIFSIFLAAYSQASTGADLVVQYWHNFYNPDSTVHWVNEPSNGPSLNLGNVSLNSTNPPQLQLQILNNTSNTITLSNLVIPSGFTLSTPFSSMQIPAQSAVSFGLQLSTTSAGTFQGNLSIQTSDSNIPAIQIPLSGVVK